MAAYYGYFLYNSHDLAHQVRMKSNSKEPYNPSL